MDGFGEVLDLAEELAYQWQEFATDTVGEESIITDVAEVAIGNVHDKPTEELQDGKRHGFGGVGVMVEIFVGDVGAVVGLDPGFAQGRAFEVFANIVDGGFTVCGLFVEMDDPGFVVENI